MDSYIAIIGILDARIESFTEKIASIVNKDDQIKLLMTMLGAPRKSVVAQSLAREQVYLNTC
jgi:hypothetical protein